MGGCAPVSARVLSLCASRCVGLSSVFSAQGCVSKSYVSGPGWGHS